MGLKDLTVESVIAAVEEFDRMGREAFLARYGFAEAATYFLRHQGKLYDSKAIAGVAHQYLDPTAGPLRSQDFSGGVATVVTRLQQLGFEVFSRSSAMDQAWTLAPGDQIRRKDLHEHYGGGRQGGISPSRKTPNVLIFTDRSVGEQHGYLDRWEGTTLHYTGEGQRGDQSMTKGNKAILEHVDTGRSLRLFDGSGGWVTYVGEFGLDSNEPWYVATAPETGGGRLRQVIMFRLVPLSQFSVGTRDLMRGEVKPSLNKTYVPVAEKYSSTRQQVFEVDPDVVDRGTRGHRVTQNLLAEWAKANRWIPIQPEAGDPPFDLGWWDQDRFVVVEVKSLTRKNERHQIRLGLGKILDYAYQLHSADIACLPVLAVEREPTDSRWSEMCAQCGVQLVWPENFEQLARGIPLTE